MPSATVEAAQGWEDLPLEGKRRFARELRRRLGVSWRKRARPDQLPPDHPWSVLLLRGGRGSGKTWAGAHNLAELIERDPFRESEGPGAWGVVAPTFAEARDKCIEGESGLLAAFGTSRAEVEAKRSAVVRTWNRSLGEMILHDGTRILIDGADDGATSIQGENLRGAWCDEIGLWKKWELAWDESIGFAVRKGEAKKIATGTPKRIMPARRLMKRLLADPQVTSRRLRTYDNIENLADAFLANVRRHEGTQLGRQELEGALLEDVEGALWRSAWFEHPTFRVSEPPYPGEWQGQPVMGVDPSDGTETGAEHAYTIAGLGYDHDLYLIANEGFRCTPYEFAVKCLLAAQAHGARIVLEKNHGGAWLTEVFDRAQIDLLQSKRLKRRIPVKRIHASQGKLTRAEPVASLYEPRTLDGETKPGRVHHIGPMDDLEDQQTGYTGSAGETSPDRLDSAVWALSEFTGNQFLPPPPESEDKAVPWKTSGNGRNGSTPVEERAVSWR